MKGDIERARRTGNPRREIRKLENVWQLKDFKSFVCGSVAGKGLTGAYFGCVARKGVSGRWPATSDQCEEKGVRSERLSRDRKAWGGANRRMVGEGRKILKLRR